MRIHVSKDVTIEKICEAADFAGAHVSEFSEHGSRSHDHAYDVYLTGNSRRRPNRHGVDQDEFAATWDEWGIFISRIFEIDFNAKMTYYENSGVFDFFTDGRFTDDSGMLAVVPADMHGDHKFDSQGNYISKCRHCSASQNWSSLRD